MAMKTPFAALLLLLGSGFASAEYLFPIQQSQVTGKPTITVNGQSSGVTVAAGSSVTVAVTNGPGNPADWVGLCTDNVSCNTYSDWDHLDHGVCTKSEPTAGEMAGSCVLTAPSSAGTYYADFFPNDQHSGILASEAFAVTGNGGGGSGCSKADSGMGASLGLTCQTSMSDDFNGSTVDASKWTLSGSPYIQSPGGGITYLTTFGTNTNGVVNTANGGVIGKNNTATNRLIYMEAVTQIVNWPSVFNTAQFWSCANGSSVLIGDCSFVDNGGRNVPEIDINETFYHGLSASAVLWNGASQQIYVNGCGTGVGCGSVNVVDGNWHTLGLKIDPTPVTGGPYGTITWYVDHSPVQVWNPPLPYWTNQSTDNRGVGYQYIMGNGCIGGGCGNGTMYQNYQYIHVYW